MIPFSWSITAHAGTKRYKVTWLTDAGDPGPLGFVPNPDTHGTMGISDKGQVCYGYVVDNEMHAWVWLPDADYGLAAGWHDIGDISGLDAPNIARDLNESGFVVGISGADVDNAGSGVVTVWFLDDPVTANDTYGTLGGTDPWSGGHAINDQSPAIVAGTSSIVRHCECPSNPEADTLQFMAAFRLALNGSPVELAPNSGDQVNGAYDVNTPASGSAVAVGHSDCLATQPCGDPPEAGCSYDLMDPMKWTGTTPTVLDRVFDNRTWALGVNDSGQIVGYAMSDTDGCAQRAQYWSTSGDEFDLGSVMPSGQSTHQSRANAINSLAQPRIVGTNLFLSHALLWEKDGADPPGSGDFVAIDINDIVGCTQWTIEQAHDINDSGWIVGIATNCDMEGYFAVLLTPIACSGDVNESGCVDWDDLNLIVNSWGDCDECSECPADIAGLTCIVDTDDYLAVVNSWCGTICPVPVCCASCPCEESFAGPGSGGPPTLADSIELVLASSQSPEMQAIIIQDMIANWP